MEPSSEFVCVKGVIFHTKLNRHINETDTNEDGTKVTFNLSHLSPLEVKYLVEQKKVVMPFSEWLKTEAGKAYQVRLKEAAAEAKAEASAAKEAEKAKAAEKAAAAAKTAAAKEG